MPGFLKLLWLAHWYVCVYVCVCVCACVRACVCVCVCALPRPLITSHVKGTRNNQIMKFYGYSVSLYDTVIDKLNRRGLSNTVGRERLPKNSQVMRY